MPQVISVVPRKRKRNWRILHFDTGEQLEVPTILIEQWELTEGRSLSETDFTRLQQLSRYHQAREAALHYIAYKPRTTQQVQKRLRDKGFAPDTIEEVIRYLQAYHYLDDAAYAEAFIQSYIQRKPSGWYRVRSELRRRGIADELIEALLSSFADEEQQMHLARQAAERKLRTLRAKPVEKRRSLLIQFLQRRGFSWEIIRAIVEEFGDELQ